MSSQIESDRMMAAMGMTTEWTAADVGYTFAMWAVMMVGMMAPAAAPVMRTILLLSRFQSHDLGAVSIRRLPN